MSSAWDPENELTPLPPKTDRERALEMAVFAASELIGALRKARGADRRRRALALRWARAIQRHLAQLLSADSTGPDTWGALTDDERQFVFADDPPRDALLARVADVLKRSGVDDADMLVLEVERRLV
jgi:hypothetical protein